MTAIGGPSVGAPHTGCFISTALWGIRCWTLFGPSDYGATLPLIPKHSMNRESRLRGPYDIERPFAVAFVERHIALFSLWVEFPGINYFMPLPSFLRSYQIGFRAGLSHTNLDNLVEGPSAFSLSFLSSFWFVFLLVCGVFAFAPRLRRGKLR